MPEGPEVHTIADWLYQELAGSQLSNLEYSSKSRYERRPIPYYQEFKTLLPLTITDVSARGKKIIFVLEVGDHAYFLVSSLGMAGKWVWEQQKHSDLWLELTTPTEEARTIYFDDARHFGAVEIFLDIEELRCRLDEIGPDLLTDEISEEEWLRKLRNRRLSPSKKIGIYLMEQKHFSGIGNYLRAEILYDARVSPHRTLNSLSDEEALLIFERAKFLIRASYEAQGATLATYRSPYGGKGTFEIIVYHKQSDPLGNPVVGEDIGDKRTTWWVPALQV